MLCRSLSLGFWFFVFGSFMLAGCAVMPNTCAAEVTAASTGLLENAPGWRRATQTVFLDSIFVSLTSVNHRAEGTAKVVYISLVICFCKLRKSCYKPSNPSQVCTHSHLLNITPTSLANISPALNQPRTRNQTSRTAPMPPRFWNYSN